MDDTDFAYFCFLSKMSSNTSFVLLHLFCKTDIKVLSCFVEIWESVLKHFDTVTLTGNKEMQISVFKPHPSAFSQESKHWKTLSALAQDFTGGKAEWRDGYFRKSWPQRLLWRKRDQGKLKIGSLSQKWAKTLSSQREVSTNTEGEILNQWRAEA